MNNSQNPQPVIINGTSLSEIVTAPGPHTTIYLSDGPETATRAAALLESPSKEESHLLERLPQSCELSICATVSLTTGIVHLFEMETSLHRDLARRSTVPALGTLVEHVQATTPHAVVTVENGEFAATSFGSTQRPVAEPSTLAVTTDVDELISQIAGELPPMIALVGESSELEAVDHQLREAFPLAWVNHYPTSNLSQDLDGISDTIVTDAASRSAEAITTELAQFRAARDAGRSLEGPSAVDAIARGLAEHVFVHDDPTDSRAMDGDRLVDLAINGALAHQCRITIIPNVPDSRGPSEGIGSILAGDGDRSPVGQSGESAPSVL